MKREFQNSILINFWVWFRYISFHKTKRIEALSCYWLTIHNKRQPKKYLSKLPWLNICMFYIPKKKNMFNEKNSEQKKKYIKKF